MRMEQLKYVLEIDRCHSMNKASKNLYISQQNLSYAIKTLEKELDITILDRRGQGCLLTEEGKLFSVFCQRVLDEWDRFQEQLSVYKGASTSNGIQGELYLYTNKMYETFILPDILGSFMMDYPNIRIKTVPTDMNESENIHMDSNFVWLLNLPKNAKELLSQPEALNEKFVFHPLFNSRSVLCVNQENPLAEKNKVSLKTALQYPLIYHGMTAKNEEAMKTGLFGQLVSYYGDYDIKIAAQTDSYGIWLDMIASGKGVGLISDKILERIAVMYPRQWERIAVVNLKEYLGYATGYAVRNDSLTEVEEIFVTYLCEHCLW